MGLIWRTGEVWTWTSTLGCLPVRLGRPPDYFTRNSEAVLALRPEDLRAAASQVVYPHRLVWVIVGDRAKIEAGLKELGLGEIKMLQPDGRPAVVASPHDIPRKAAEGKL